MNKHVSRRRVSVRVLALCLGSGAALLVPSVALGADAGTGGTVRATIDNNGAVTSAKQVASNGATSAFAGQLPIKMSITHTTSGAAQTYTYHVENTFSRTQTVHFTDTAGHERHTSVQLQLPLVAQLGVDVPGSMTGLTATGATVTTGANGVRHVLWSMVLFTPLGTSSQDVSFTASGKGTPVAELRASSVDPSTAPGLSTKSQDATAEFQQEDFWAGYAGGGNDGLTKLADGANQLVVGLGQLLSGLKTGVSGANQLADGSASAHDGSVQLRDGLAKIHAGLADSPVGLTGGLRLINGGQVDLTAGLKKIRNGLAQLASYKNHPGLQQAADGVAALNAGVAGLLNGLRGNGTAASPGVLVDQNGNPELDQNNQPIPSVLLGLMGSKSAIDGQAATLLTDLVTLKTMATAPSGSGGDTALQTLLGTDPAFASAFADPATGLLTDLTVAAIPAGTPGLPPQLANGGVLVQVSAGLGKIIGGLQLITLHLDHGTGTTPDPNGILDPVGIKGGLEGLADPTTGLPAAVAGINKLYAGSKDAFSGSSQLAAGSGKALSGSEQLLAGSGDAYSGSKDLATGLGKIATGNKQVADGLPPAVDGVTQLLDGTTQVHDGITQVQSGATGPLQDQLEQSSRNAHQQIAVLTAAAALASEAPGGAGTSYVLAQPGSIALAANSSSTGSSHTGRNALLISLGGLVALAIGLGAGVAVGRQRVSA